MTTEAQRQELAFREGEGAEEYKVRVDGLQEKWAQERREARAVEREESRPSGSSGFLRGAKAKDQERAVEEAVSALEGQLEDPKTAERKQLLKEAAAKSKGVARGARSRLGEADGTTERARQEFAEWNRAMM